MIKGFFDRKTDKEALIRAFKEGFGKAKVFDFPVPDHLKKYFYSTASKNIIDDQTAKDLDIDFLYNRLDYTVSPIGKEYLYRLLRTPENKKVLTERENVISAFSQRFQASQTESETLFELSAILGNISSKKKLSFYEYINRLNEVKPKGTVFHVFCLLGFVSGILVAPFWTMAGVVIIIAFVALNIVSYFMYRQKLSPYLETMMLVAAMSEAALGIKSLQVPELKKYTESLVKNEKAVHKIYRNRFLLKNTVNGSIVSFFTDYLFMLTHIDLITFNFMLKTAVESKSNILELYETLGFIDSMLSIASFRASLPEFVLPDFIENNGKRPEISATGLYHPLVADCVSNDIDFKNSVLLTGSNASGKSTFLREVGVNLLLAETINTVAAKDFRTSFVKIMSSMSISDNLLAGKSYFFSEISAAKRILDSEDSQSLVCFVDELFKGTNTRERIAANLAVLSELNFKGALVFAASHDLELCTELEDYENYHFQESFDNNDMYFSYKLFKGPSDSTNAIKLMETMGFNKNIIDRANAMLSK